MIIEKFKNVKEKVKERGKKRQIICKELRIRKEKIKKRKGEEEKE